jgi:anti-anti-sigma factor
MGMSGVTVKKRVISANEIEVCPQGELSTEALQELQRALDEALRGTHGRIALNLEGVARLNSAAIGKILFFKKRCDEAGRLLVVRRCNPEMLQLLRMVNFDSLIDLEA